LRERLASQSYDKRRRCVSGKRGARLPACGRQQVTGFLLGLLFSAGVGIIWAGLTRSEDDAGDGVLRRFIEAQRRSVPTPRFAALGVLGAFVLGALAWSLARMPRSEERRVGKEGSGGGGAWHEMESWEWYGR